MTEFEHDDPVEVRLAVVMSREEMDFGDLLYCLRLLDESYQSVGDALLANSVSNAEDARPPLGWLERPRVARIEMHSPLLVELLATGTISTASVLALRTLGRALRNPQDIGAFFPRITQGWYDARKEAYEARQRLDALRNAAGELLIEGGEVVPVRQSRRRRVTE